jgi:hypothetical protein
MVEVVWNVSRKTISVENTEDNNTLYVTKIGKQANGEIYIENVDGKYVTISIYKNRRRIMTQFDSVSEMRAWIRDILYYWNRRDMVSLMNVIENLFTTYYYKFAGIV